MRGFIRSVVAFLFFASVAGAEVVSIPFGRGANSTFQDNLPEDQKGGWIDLGGNDLRLFPMGNVVAAGVPFDVAAGEDGKTCIVLGGPTRAHLPKTAVVEVGAREGTHLYLLHAAAFPPAKDETVGRIRLDYASGKTKTRNVRMGRDAADWLKPDAGSNAARAWTIYNGNTQVSLFVSVFKLDDGEKLKTVAFESDRATWMIVGASLGDELKIRPLVAPAAITKIFRAPPPLSVALPVRTDSARPKNVILLIGDGMGAGAIKLTSQKLHAAPGKLVFQQMPAAGLCRTHSFKDDVTDSAASGSALACGEKTLNGRISVRSDGTEMTSAATLAKRAGCSVGIITSDSILGATPAVHYAHSSSRQDYAKIAASTPVSGFDFMAGALGGYSWFVPKSDGGKRDDGKDVRAALKQAGYSVCTNLETLAAAPQDLPAMGFFSPTDETCLADLLGMALKRFEKNDKGFFIMLESSLPDSGGHGNKPDVTLLGVTQLDWAARTALEFAAGRDDTLVVLTADHETGMLSSVQSAVDGSLVFLYQTTSHTAAAVEVYAFGPGSSRFAGVIDNTDIGRFLCETFRKDPK